MPVDIGTGLTIVFGTSGFTANIMKVAPVSGGSRPAIDTSHLGTTNARTYMPGDLIDWGDCEIEFQFDPDSRPPIDQSPETVTITYPLSATGQTPAGVAGTAFMTDFDNEVMYEELMTGSATLKWSGDLNWTDEVPA